MLTQCPGCQTVFRITGTILRAAHGQVRCGRCNTQFDAIEHIIESDNFIEDAPEQSKPGTAAASASRNDPVDDTADEATQFMPSAFDQAAAPHEEITMEGDRINIDEFFAQQSKAEAEHSSAARLAETGPTEESSTDADLAEADSDDYADDSIIEEFNIASEEWQNPFKAAAAAIRANAALEETKSTMDAAEPEERTLVRTMASFTNEYTEHDQADNGNHNDYSHQHADVDIFGNAHASAFDQSLDADANPFNAAVFQAAQTEHSQAEKELAEDESSSPAQEHAAEKTQMRHWPRRQPRNSAKPKSLPQLDELEPEPFVQSPATRWRWLAATVLLSLMLSVQVIHHYRQTLVRHPGFGSMLKTVYATFGQQLEPRWELNAYSIKQWGIVSDPQEPGVLRVRASITNNASFAQPHPLLKLTLEDRYGTKLGMREFTPAEYLASAAGATRLLDAGVAANVDLGIVDPGEEAVGFQFDTCLADNSSDGSNMRCAHE